MYMRRSEAEPSPLLIYEIARAPNTGGSAPSAINDEATHRESGCYNLLLSSSVLANTAIPCFHKRIDAIGKQPNGEDA